MLKPELKDFSTLLSATVLYDSSLMQCCTLQWKSEGVCQALHGTSHCCSLSCTHCTQNLHSKVIFQAWGCNLTNSFFAALICLPCNPPLYWTSQVVFNKIQIFAMPSLLLFSRKNYWWRTLPQTKETIILDFVFISIKRPLKPLHFLHCYNANGWERLFKNVRKLHILL